MLIILLLILLTAFFVAAEFAIVKVRLTRLEEMAGEGNKRAKAAKKIVEHLDAYLSTTQLGITITALIIGWAGEPAFSRLFDPVLGMIGINSTINQSISAVISFIIITYINVVFGELAPKSIAIQQAEKITLLIAFPLIWFNRFMFPFIWLLNKTSNNVTRLFGISPDANKEAALTEEELKLILSNSYKGGEINQLELQYLNRIFDFDERTSREIMVPRTEIICLYKDHTLEENLEILRQEKFTRFPVVDGDKDTIVGMINIKDIFDDFLIDNIQTLDHYIRPIISVIETTPIRELLTKMQKLGIHMAMLTDEYGGTAGLVTVEDIIEEIVGDIRDEYDEHEEPMVQYVTPNHLIVDGKVLISEINHLLNLDINNDDLDTIGGWLLSKNDDAKVGNIIYLSDYAFVVHEVDHHHIKKITIRPKQALKAQ
ncbi:DUF21 domain-containing protein [Terrilactibacillus sp. BCM23-1]|uniref:DUF21 domain-containing protein n=1 Tax=Terrilactibacillus tamarindi TaxID=2599694 RepID=A0A6N8CND0_9BACI|nr:DUF21 domain-containing protein [Terrilactibacillus tamarindi]